MLFTEHLKEEEGIQHGHVSGKMPKKNQQSKISEIIFKLDSLISSFHLFIIFYILKGLSINILNISEAVLMLHLSLV